MTAEIAFEHAEPAAGLAGDELIHLRRRCTLYFWHDGDLYSANVRWMPEMGIPIAAPTADRLMHDYKATRWQFP